MQNGQKSSRRRSQRKILISISRIPLRVTTDEPKIKIASLDFYVIGLIPIHHQEFPKNSASRVGTMSLLLGRRKGKGEIIKAERILVRIERIDNPKQKLPAEYNENHTVDTRLKREWREYYVVARAAQEKKHIILHIHKNRVSHYNIDC
jgi:hypothetical protein